MLQYSPTHVGIDPLHAAVPSVLSTQLRSGEPPCSVKPELHV